MFCPKSSQSVDPLILFLPIGPHEGGQVPLPRGTARKYETPDFLATVRSMRGKLLELQEAACREEPTRDKDILKTWKASNNLIYRSTNVSRFTFIKTQFSVCTEDFYFQ